MDASGGRSRRDLGTGADGDAEGRRPRLLGQLARGAVDQHIAVLQQHIAVGGALDFKQVVRDDDNDVPLIREPAEVPPDQRTSHRVDVVGRLVDEQHWRGCDHGHRVGGQAAQPAGELLAAGALPLGDVELIDQGARLAARVRTGEPAQSADRRDRLQRRDACERSMHLRHHRGHPSSQIRFRHKRRRTVADIARGRLRRADDLIEQRGLTRSVVPDERDQLACSEGEADGSIRRGGSSSIGLRDIFQRERLSRRYRTHHIRILAVSKKWVNYSDRARGGLCFTHEVHDTDDPQSATAAQQTAVAGGS